MKVAQAISRALVSEGVTLCAGLAGQSISPIIDALGECEEVSLVYARQERVAFDICDGFARASGNPAVVFADSGPAAANLMGGIVNSWGDSVPVLFIAGHNERTRVASKFTKELPFLDIFSPVSKWAAMVDDPAKVAETLRRAFMHLRTGRPGPVALAIPEDVAHMEVGNFEYQPISPRPRVRGGGDPDAINAAIELIANAERPYVYVGAGVLFSDATDELVRFAEMLTLPVATTLNGKSAFPEDHPLALGLGGFGRANYGTLAASVAGENADVILTIGCGFKQHTTLVRPSQRTRHIQVDVDPTEVNRDHVADVAILGDAKVVLRQLAEAARARLPAARLAPVERRAKEIGELNRRWQIVSAPLLDSDETPINPFRVTRAFMKLVDPAQTIVLHDAGSVRGTTSQHYIAPRPRSFIGFGVQSAMGWSLGAAIGAKKAHPDKLVTAFIGEEALNETAMDIETSIRNDAPILMIVKNNRKPPDQDSGKSKKLALARFKQGVDIGALAAALGAKAYRIEKPGDLATTLSAAIADVRGGQTAVVEVMTARVNASLHHLWDTSAAKGGG
ncbi:MAG TPA: thiamine pyrophosphate-binding protein [Xanthobacteraceae bacterium]|nr:thiamine pyrophosphate-binding protein [Xanthobacteraceae bacterium]